MEEDSARQEKDPSKAILEAILFSYGAPISQKRLAAIVEKREEEIAILLDELREDLEREKRGVRVLTVGDEVQLGSAPEFGSFVEKLFKEDFKEELTPASLETLAIICYRGPISRGEIDFIRGVNSSFILRSLLLRGLVSREPDPARPHVWHYQPSFELLKLLGVTSKVELPEYTELSKKLNELAETLEAGEKRDTAPELSGETA